MKKHVFSAVLSILLILISVTLVEASLCYQETANVSTVCGGLATGAYAWDSKVGNKNLFDENWDTYNGTIVANVIATGITTPDTEGIYEPIAPINGYPAWQNIKGDTYYYLFLFDPGGFSDYALDVNDTLGGPYFLRSSGNYNLIGEYTAFAGGSGTFDVRANITDEDFYINYTKPSDVLNASWSVKYNFTNVQTEENLTIHTSCLSQNITQLKVVFDYDTSSDLSFECKNQTNWYSLKQMTESSDILPSYLFEEAMWWDACSTNLTNTSWNSWSDYSACYINNTQLRSRSLVQYDINYCGLVANTTIYQYETGSCIYTSECQGVREALFAGFGLIALGMIVLAGFMLTKLSEGGADVGIILATVIGNLSLGLVLMVGYYITMAAYNSLCLW